MLAVSAAAISSDSLWIDEGLSAFHAKAETAPGMWKSILDEGNSNLQLPLYHFYLWGWAQIFGTSELSLRAANAPLLFLVFGAFVYLLRTRAGALNWSVLALLTSAMLWSYLDESRPYVMILAASAWSISASLKPFFLSGRFSNDTAQQWNTRVLLCSLLWLSACSMIALPWCLTIFLAWIFVVRTAFLKFLLAVWPTALLCIVFLLAILAYYAWTVSLDARATPGATNLITIAFAVYENLGFSGFGPSRQMLRDSPIAALLNHAGLLLLPTLAAALSFALIARTVFFSSSLLRKLLPPLLIISIAFLIVQVLGIVGDVRILGRHVIPVLLVWSLALGIACADVLKSPNFVLRSLPFLILGIFLSSSLLYRFGSTHQKDNYREAAAWALQEAANGRTVLWAADVLTGKYYGLRDTSPHTRKIALLREDNISDLTGFDAIVLSKPDLYDPQNAIRSLIEEKDFENVAELKAFTLWTKQKSEL